MRISSKADLDRLTKGGGLGQSGISGWASSQIEKALADSTKGGRGQANPGQANQKKASRGSQSHQRQIVGESPGEASVRLALIAAFGDWHNGGEVVAELMPFRTRRFRADFALPRARITAEVEGWSHHGFSLSDHEADRERGLFFASHDWLAFQVSHGQAVNNPGMLVDAIAKAMTYRTLAPRESIELEAVPHKRGTWYRLV